MMEVKEALRRLAAGQGLREIARQTGVSRKTVRRYADAADSRELTPEMLHDDALVQAIIAAVQGASCHRNNIPMRSSKGLPQ
jgi:hypothetical protein